MNNSIRDINDPIFQTSGSFPQGSIVDNSNIQDVSSLADLVPVEVPEAEITESIAASKKIDWKSVSIKALSFFSAMALGALTALVLAGVMVTPAGWAIAGGALLIGLIGSAYCGGPKEFAEAVKYSLSGFTIGFGIGISGLAIAQMVPKGLALAGAASTLAGSLLAAKDIDV